MIARLAELGFVHVEPYRFTNNTPELRSAMTAAGVTAPSGHAPVIDSQSPESVFDAAAESTSARSSTRTSLTAGRPRMK